MFIGQLHYLQFLYSSGAREFGASGLALFLRGAWFSIPVLAILGCHELGHYLACRYYDVDASLPFFLPFPLAFSGTLGAFIRIREPIPSKRMLFDIGIAGPIAGFVIIVPALIVGIAMSSVGPIPHGVVGQELGEPLLLKLVARLVWGHLPVDTQVNWHPIAFAAWFGMLATALNLFPIGQLDGGHISYAVLGRKSSLVTIVMLACAVSLIYFSISWVVWSGLLLLMLFVFGPHHPRTFDENVPLDSGRMWLALFAVLMFVLCFTPAPIGPEQLLP
jgi:membrane-associated protease RseP (regulator of RpoE activity)